VLAALTGGALLGAGTAARAKASGVGTLATEGARLGATSRAGALAGVSGAGWLGLTGAALDGAAGCVDGAAAGTYGGMMPPMSVWERSGLGRAPGAAAAGGAEAGAGGALDVNAGTGAGAGADGLVSTGAAMPINVLERSGLVCGLGRALGIGVFNADVPGGTDE
jgi:hypothetical protein